MKRPNGTPPSSAKSRSSAAQVLADGSPVLLWVNGPDGSQIARARGADGSDSCRSGNAASEIHYRRHPRHPRPSSTLLNRAGPVCSSVRATRPDAAIQGLSALRERRPKPAPGPSLHARPAGPRCSCAAETDRPRCWPLRRQPARQVQGASGRPRGTFAKEPREDQHGHKSAHGDHQHARPLGGGAACAAPSPPSRNVPARSPAIHTVVATNGHTSTVRGIRGTTVANAARAGVTLVATAAIGAPPARATPRPTAYRTSAVSWPPGPRGARSSRPATPCRDASDGEAA